LRDLWEGAFISKELVVMLRRDISDGLLQEQQGRLYRDAQNRSCRKSRSCHHRAE